MTALNWTEIILGAMTQLGCCGWFVNRRRYKLDVSTEFVSKFRKLIVEPLEAEVDKLRTEVKELRDAIEGIYDCPYRDGCPVRDRCSATRSMSSSTDLRTTESRMTEAKDSVMVEMRDTLKEVTVITIDRNEVGDTLKVSTVTDRERVRDRSAVRAQETRVEVRVDTVYVERRDSVMVQETLRQAQGDSGGRASALVQALKWVFWIIVSITVLFIILKYRRFRLWQR